MASLRSAIAERRLEAFKTRFFDRYAVSTAERSSD
jgi:hypothetical protein